MSRKYPGQIVECHLHTSYSILDGAINVKSLAKRIKEMGQKGAFITDHGNMSGWINFYKTFKAEGLKPGLGIEVYTEGIDGDKEKQYHLILLAKNNTGINNLYKIISKAQENFYKKALVSYDLLEKYSEGVICSTACLAGEVNQSLLKRDIEKAEKTIEKLISIYGKEDLYMEIQNHNIRDEQIIEKDIVSLAKKYELKLLATNDAHYLTKEQKINHEVILCVQTGNTIDDEKRFKFDGDGYYIHTPEEMEERFKDYPEALDNTVELLEKCDVEIEFGNIHIPNFPVPEGYTVDSYFDYLCRKGFEEIFTGTDKLTNPEYQERLNYEIEVIKKMGYSGYFLIVWDFIRYAKENGVSVGPGRGSAAGSIVSYCLRITDLDPIEYGLIFERFLNPDRVSMPDIDIDFQDVKRHKVIEYVINKYGVEKVAQIITMGSMAAKSAVRDVARVLKYPYAIGDKIAKLIPDTPKITIEKAFEESAELRQLYATDEICKKVIDIAKEIDGTIRQTGRHAAGVVITPKSVEEYVPKIRVHDKKANEYVYVTQYNMVELEELGLLKMDFLGLKALTTTDNSLNLINEKRTTQGLSKLTVDDLDIHNPLIYQTIGTGETEGVFQLESKGMQAFMRQLFNDVTAKIEKIYDKYPNVDKEILKPFVEKSNFPIEEPEYKAFLNEMKVLGKEFFERLIAGISMYRPGPMSSIPNLIENMNNPQSIKYSTPLLEPILNKTYGILIYQEQVMQIVRDLAGYSYSRSDLVRKAMGKKKMDVMAEERQYFIHGKTDKDGNIEIEGCIRRGVPEDIANTIFDDMIDFAKYAFNKSHAACYAVLGARMAYLKCFYLPEFMAATLNGSIDDSEKLRSYLLAAKKNGLTILPPDINYSHAHFVTENDNIRFGLMGVKNLGDILVQIEKERSQNGKYDSLQNLIERLAKKNLINKKVFEGLVYCGALDNFNYSRRALIMSSEKIINYSRSVHEQNQSDQISLFEINDDLNKLTELKIENLEEYERMVKLKKEKEYSMLFISSHPLDDYKKIIQNQNIDFLDEIMEDPSKYQYRLVNIACIVTEVKMKFGKKNGNVFYVFTVEDQTGSMNCIYFPQDNEKMDGLLFDNALLIVTGKVKVDDFGTQLTVEKVTSLKQLENKKENNGIILYPSNIKQVNEINNLIKNNPGNTNVYIYYLNQKMKSKTGINYNNTTSIAIQDIVGQKGYDIKVS